MEHRKYGVFGATEGGGTSHFFTSGSEVRDYHKVKKIGLSEGGEETLWSKMC